MIWTQRYCFVIAKPHHVELLQSIADQLGGAGCRESLEHFLNCYLAGDAPINQIPSNGDQLLVQTEDVEPSAEKQTKSGLKLVSSKIPIELMERLNRHTDSTGLTQSAAIRQAIGQFLNNVEQVPVKSENVATRPNKEKVTRRFGTPKNRQSIENLKRIYLLDQMGFYEPCWPYFDPTSQSVIFYFHDDGSKFNTDHPEKLPPVVMLWELWEIPDEHPSFSDITCIRWDWEIASYPLDGQLKEAFECLKKLDKTLLRPVEGKCGTITVPEAAWAKRLCGFFRGDFEKILTSTQETLILELVESSMARVSKELEL